MKKVLIPLAGMPNQRDMDSLQSLIEGKDQRFRNLYIIPIDNPLVGSRKVYVEKRPGFEVRLTPAEGCPGGVIFYSSVQDKFITSFCGTDVFVNETPVGDTIEPDPDGPACSPLLQCFFANDSGADVSGNNMTFVLGDDYDIRDEALWAENNPQDAFGSTYTGGDINNHPGTSYSWGFYIYAGAGGSGFADRRISGLFGDNTDARVGMVRSTLDSTYLQLYYRGGQLFDSVFTGIKVPVNTWTHFEVDVDQSVVPNEVYLFQDGVLRKHDTNNRGGPFPTANGMVSWGSSSSASDTPIAVTDIYVNPCVLHTANFTPPARVGGG